jgi:hypothetical protein
VRVAALTPDQLRTRHRVEAVIRLMAPALDLVLAVGDRVSRIVERDDPEYYPPRVERGPAGAPPRPVEGRPFGGDSPSAGDPPPAGEAPPAGGAPPPSTDDALRPR